MGMTRGEWIGACGALAAGEGVASLVPQGADCWPAVAIVAVLAVLFGYGLGICGWRFAAIFLVGVALFFHASVGEERMYRDSPWMRNVRRRVSEKAPDNPVRMALSRRVGIGLEHDPLAANLNRAILLGERKRLPWKVRKTFVASGTMHVFAISGLHVMLVAKVLVLAMLLLMVPMRWAGAVAILPLWGYVAVVGAPPSAVRAAVMATFYFLAPVFWRKSDSLMAWALTFLLTHVYDPTLIGNVGCLLSFAVMLAILFALDLGSGLGKGLKMSLWVTFAAWLMGVPISAHVFGQVTPGGLLANLPLLAAAGFTVISGIVGLGASFVSETLAAHLNNLAALFTEAMVGVSGAVAQIPGSNFEIVKWPLWMCALWYVAVLLSLYLVRRVKARRCGII